MTSDTSKEVHGARAFRFTKMKDGKEIARAWLYLIHNDLHREPFGLLEDLFVEQAHRGKGLATELLDQVIMQARQEKCYKLIATSRTERKEVHKLYTMNDFTLWGNEFRLEL